jgi:hypothetical protein
VEKRKAIVQEYSSALKPKALLPVVASSSVYYEYAPDGKLLNPDTVVALSRFDEDVVEGNHREIWGSYFDQVGCFLLLLLRFFFTSTVFNLRAALSLFQFSFGTFGIIFY